MQDAQKVKTNSAWCAAFCELILSHTVVSPLSPASQVHLVNYGKQVAGEHRKEAQNHDTPISSPDSGTRHRLQGFNMAIIQLSARCGPALSLEKASGGYKESEGDFRDHKPSSGIDLNREVSLHTIDRYISTRWLTVLSPFAKFNGLLALSIVLSVSPGNSATLSPPAQDGHSQEARALYRQGNIAQCEKELLNNIEHARKYGPSDRRLANALEDLATFYRNEGNYAKAEGLLEKVLKVREQTLGTDYPSTSLCRRRLSKVCELEGKYKRAEELLRVDIAQKKKTLGELHPAVATALLELARVYAEDGKHSPDAARESLKIREKLLQPADAYKKALEAAANQKDGNGIELAASVGKLAQIYEQQGRWPEAEQLEKRILQVYEKKLSDDDPLVTDTVNRLANVYIQEGNIYIQESGRSAAPERSNQAALEKYRLAVAILKPALVAEEKKYGKDDSELLQILLKLGDAEKQLKNNRESAEIFDRAIANARKNKQPEAEFSALVNLAYLYESQWKFDETEALLRKLIELREKKDEPNKVGLASVFYMAAGFYKNHGTIQRDSRKFAISEQFYDRTLELYKNIFGPNSPQVTGLITEIAQFRLYRQKFENERNARPSDGRKGT